MADLPEFVVDGEWEDPECSITHPFRRHHPYSFDCFTIVVGDRRLYFADKDVADAWVERVTRAPQPLPQVTSEGTQRVAYYGSGKQPLDTMIERGWAAAFAAGSIVKYLRRQKGEREADLAKARWFDAWLKELRERGDPLTVSRATGAMWGLSCELTLEEAKLLIDEPTT